jgi:hypothetical protein
MLLFGASFAALNHGLPAMADGPEGSPLVAVCLVGSLAFVVTILLSAHRRFVSALACALLIVLSVGGWAVAGPQDEMASANAPIDASDTTTSTDDPQASTTTATGNGPTTMRPPPADGSSTPEPVVTGLPPTGPSPTTTVRQPCPSVASSGSISGATSSGEHRVEELSYQLSNLNDPHVEMAGRLVGDLAPSEGFYLVKTANPDTYDATTNRNPGTPNFWIQEETSVNEGTGCWSYPSSKLAYSCAGGVEFRFYFMVIPDTTAQSIEAQKPQHPGGMPPEMFLSNSTIQNLGRLVVPTPVDPNCPGA